MRLYLARHGQAKAKSIDPQRGLTDAGVESVRRVAAFLQVHHLDVHAIWHSTKTRARQTAELLAPAFGAADKLMERDGMAPNDEVDSLVTDLAAHDGDLVVVGHMPYLSHLASVLLAGRESGSMVGFSPASILCLERSSDGLWHLLWMIGPELILTA